ncbi:class I adenylate-forming enzyme family protein [Halobellus captivus]|uniref:class I adenylate-forming enzyme family protein n=1 Tax=Halobellus captivus TaxID=2592614 RepID=UPI00119FBE69|nr:class I adenylate-forming enzyme family protein [Halobellus captivus]
MHSTATFELPGLHEMSEIAAANDPNRIAYGEAISGREVTWAEFEDRSARAANAFDEHCGQGDRVAFLCDCSIAHTTLLNGALKAGCIVSNLHTRASVETLRYCIDAISPRVLVLDEEFSELVETDLLGSTSTDIAAVVTTGAERTDYERAHESLIDAHPPEAPDIRVREDDVACVQWTSGTTGRPKGWCHTHRGLGLKGIQLEKLLALDRTASQAHVFTPSFAAWYSLFLPALYSSAATYYLSEWDAEAYIGLIDEKEITTADLVPTMWQEVLRLDSLSEYDLSSLNRAITSGEYLDEQTFRALREEICDDVYNSYAATEVLGTGVSAEEIANGRTGTVGKPISTTRIRIVEEGGAPDATKDPGDVGEIIIKGPDCAVWAWKDTERTERAFRDGWWYSGDLGYKDEDGYLYVEGRTDFMIKSKGIKVAPTPIEERLKAHPGVEQAAVVGVPDDEYGQKVTAVVRRSDPDVTSDELESWCLESDDIARFERPRTYHFVNSSFPRTATDKLDRAGVLDLLEPKRE